MSGRAHRTPRPIRRNTFLSSRESGHPTSKESASALSSEANSQDLAGESCPRGAVICKSPETYHSDSGSQMAAVSSLQF